MITDLSEKFRLIDGTMVFQDQSLVTTGKCNNEHSGPSFARNSHMPILINGYCAACWERAYYEAIDKMVKTLNLLDTRPKSREDSRG